MIRTKMTSDRQSNIELLRIIAMLFVVGLHANYFSLGMPTEQELSHNIVPTIFRIFLELCCVCGVDIFILISGRFRIRPNIKGLMKLLFQSLFIAFFAYVLSICLGYAMFSLKDIYSILSFNKGYWFILTYIGLYLVSPILNAYLDKTSRRQQMYVIASLILFQAIFSWLLSSAPFIASGFSVFSFVILYLLGNYIGDINVNKCKMGGGIVVLSILLNFLLAIFVLKLGIPRFARASITYTNPLVILTAAGIFMVYNAWHIKHSKTINFISASVLSVYLFHMAPGMIDIFKQTVINIYTANSGIKTFCLIFAFCTIVFIISIVIDQIRKLLWNLIDKIAFKGTIR